MVPVVFAAALLCAPASDDAATTTATIAPHPPMAANRKWDVLTATASERQKLAQAGRKLNAGRFDLAGTWVDGATLVTLSKTPACEPLTRALREALERPVDVDDLLLFIDDLLAHGVDLEARPAYLPAGRARGVGVLLHPNDVFRKNRPRRYGERVTVIPLDAPTPQLGLKPARDGSVVGPNWAARYQQPETEQGRIDALQKANPSFGARVASLTKQLKAQGAFVFVDATVRAPERGYLLYGSYRLSRSESKKTLLKRIRELRRINKQWGLDVPIRWMHPKGWRATVDAARQLADTYGVVYATRRGARSSDHYGGKAIDLSAMNLPRRLTLIAPDRAELTIELSGPDESRDLSLTPRLVNWIEAHFAMKKLRKDYPHWSDAAKP